jgi:hypothetical protein
MKKAYNENWVENLHIQQTASAWLSKNLLTQEQFEQVKAAFPNNSIDRASSSKSGFSSSLRLPVRFL